nr:MAG: hypothetical protein [Porcellio scaber clopovirus]
MCVTNAYGIEGGDFYKFLRYAPLKKLREDYTKLYLLSLKPDDRGCDFPFSERDKPFQILFQDFLLKYLEYNGKSRADLQKFKTVFIHRNLHLIRAFLNFFYPAAEFYINHELDKEGKQEDKESNIIDEEIQESKYRLFESFIKRVKEERENFFRENEALKFKDRKDRGEEEEEDEEEEEEEEEDDFDCDFELEDVEDIWKKDILFIKMIETPYEREQILSKFDEIKKESERLYLISESEKLETNTKPSEKRDVKKIVITPERVETNDHKSDLEEGEITRTTGDEKRQGVKRKSDLGEGKIDKDDNDQIQEKEQQRQQQQHPQQTCDDYVNDVNDLGTIKEDQRVLKKTKIELE